MSFKPFDPHGELETYQHHLPHWRQKGVTYFITMRLADSIPQSKLREWEHDRRCWLQANGCGNHDAFQQLPEKLRNEFHRRFTQKFHAWLDAGYGACWLRRPDAAQIVSEALRYFAGSRYALGDFVVMPNHLHALISPVPGHELKNITHSWKSFTAKQINRLLNHTGRFWQAESYDHIVRSVEQLEHYRQYIADNPIKARLKEGEYLIGTST